MYKIYSFKSEEKRSRRRQKGIPNIKWSFRKQDTRVWLGFTLSALGYGAEAASCEHDHGTLGSVQGCVF